MRLLLLLMSLLLELLFRGEGGTSFCRPRRARGADWRERRQSSRRRTAGRFSGSQYGRRHVC
jgi:hypothetical protein